ncbi:T9SS type A sorting domain-containing protein [Hymenobacter sp. BT683]|uniref:T9SS type A sorting domain-containing protein n=1 Tax=Hymenobacter jeongseonensis TaxID=2791027 RepID=A0ABS0IH20_9BACT|nr:T9SS type A sorting domain-containing protein [Hymenobacter jeongseonensis]MBF9237659.1 T9SS type A sorting domain-containing protein [Hymenobacter jeongseonensis]
MKHFFSFALRPGGARPAVMLALSLGLAPAAFGQTVTFAPAVNYGTGLSSQNVAVGDFNNDGKPDVVTFNVVAASAALSVRLNLGAGSFGPATNYAILGAGPGSVAVGDFNGDGKLDLAVATTGRTPRLSVLLNTGTAAMPGTFGAAVTYGAGGPDVAVGDFNGDNKPDLAVVSGIGSGTMSVLLNNTGAGTAPGTVSFAPAVTYNLRESDDFSFLFPRGVAVGDFNGDSKPDLAVATSRSTVAVLLNTGTGSFGFRVLYGVGDSNNNDVAVGDFNGDNKPDLAVASSFGSVGVLLSNTGTGTGNFGAAVSYPVAGGALSVAVGDFDADGKPDLAVTGSTSSSSNQVRVLRGTGAGAFGAATAYTVGGTGAGAATGVAASDLDGDGRLDLVTGISNNANADNLAVLLSTSERDLEISDVQDIPAGFYRNITIKDGGFGTLLGDIAVSGALVVEDGGTLYTFGDNCSRITGAGTFTLAAGGYLEICDAAGIALTGATGTVQTAGARSFSDDASYDYTAEEAQVTGSGLPATVRELYSFNDFDVTLTQAVAIRQLLEPVKRGNLQLNGQALTLLSDANGTALVVNNVSELTGDVLGKVLGNTATVQRYLDPSLNPGLGYRHYSAPVTGSTVADLDTKAAGGSFSPEVSQASRYNASATPGRIAPFPTVFGYDQARVTMTSTYTPFDRGFVVPAGLSAPLAVGRGYAVQIAGTEKVDFTGTLNTGDINVGLSRLGENADAGWALVGNPYPAPIDGAALFENNNATGLEESFYVVESTSAYEGMYRAIARNFEGDQNTLIAAGQGFFVRVAEGAIDGAQLQFRDAQRVTDFGTQVRMYRGTASTQPTVALTLRGTTGPVDKLFVYAAAAATPGFDSGYDAWKLPNSTGLNLSSVAATGEALAIDGRPAFAAGTAVALRLSVPTAGRYTLNALRVANLPAGLVAYLHDAATGQQVDLSAQPTTTVTLPAGLSTRYRLVFAPATALTAAPALTAAQVALFPNPAGTAAAVQVTLPVAVGTRTAHATVLNTLGQVVRETALAVQAGQASGTLRTQGLAAGVYVVRLQAGAEVVSKRLVVD